MSARNGTPAAPTNDAGILRGMLRQAEGRLHALAEAFGDFKAKHAQILMAEQNKSRALLGMLGMLVARSGANFAVTLEDLQAFDESHTIGVGPIPLDGREGLVCEVKDAPPPGKPEPPPSRPPLSLLP